MPPQSTRHSCNGGTGRKRNAFVARKDITTAKNDVKSTELSKDELKLHGYCHLMAASAVVFSGQMNNIIESHFIHSSSVRSRENHVGSDNTQS